jgi:hypothetical protein
MWNLVLGSVFLWRKMSEGSLGNGPPRMVHIKPKGFWRLVTWKISLKK